MKKLSAAFLAKLAWVAIAFAILIMWITATAQSQSPEGYVSHALLMLVISFPAGYLATYVIFGGHMLVEAIVGHGPAPGMGLLLFEWGAFFVLGFVQWFILLPAIYRWFRTRQGGAEAGTPRH